MSPTERPAGQPGQPLWIVGIIAVVICLAFLGFRLSG
jgi:hypothetical protein